MDTIWFKGQMRRRALTQEDLAEILSRDRSAVSRILNGKQPLQLDQAKLLASALDLPLAEILERADRLDEGQAQTLQPGFSESDAAPWVGKPGEVDATERRAVEFGGGKPGIDVWTVKSRAMILGGYLPGDRILVDTHQSERCRAGDVVIAQKYDGQTGTATTVLRRYEPPVLVAASLDPEDQRALTVDWNNVVIRGKVIAAWRETSR